MTNLVSLDLSANYLADSLPPALSRATSLQSLVLDNNTSLCGDITRLNSGGVVSYANTNITIACPQINKKQSDLNSLTKLSAGLGAKASSSWLVANSYPCSDWVGISCSAAGDVQGVNLTGEAAWCSRLFPARHRPVPARAHESKNASDPRYVPLLSRAPLLCSTCTRPCFGKRFRSAVYAPLISPRASSLRAGE